MYFQVYIIDRTMLLKVFSFLIIIFNKIIIYLIHEYIKNMFNNCSLDDFDNLYSHITYKSYMYIYKTHNKE